jgi:hypothetical protein
MLWREGRRERARGERGLRPTKDDQSKKTKEEEDKFVCTT